MEGFHLLDAATKIFDSRLSTVTAAQWTRPTPCEGWSVRDLAGHVVDGNHMAVELLREDTPGHHGNAAQDPVLGFRRSAQRQRVAFASTDRTRDVAHRGSPSANS